MSSHIGEEFDGIICNITSFGIFVQLENSAEGLIFYSSMPDYMVFDEKKMIASGESNRRKYAIGDPARGRPRQQEKLPMRQARRPANSWRIQSSM